jgi:TRAP-type C4-dicarboxylate transport system permease small subunit
VTPARPADAAAPAGALALAVRWIDRAIVALATVATVAALAALFLSLMAEVIIRYLTTQGLGWPNEMPAILFPWLTMGGAVLAAQRGRHIAVTFLPDLLPPAAARWLLIAINLMIAAVFLYLAQAGRTVMAIAGGQVYPVSGIQASWAYGALVAGFVLIGLTALTTLPMLLTAADPCAVRRETEDHA